MDDWHLVHLGSRAAGGAGLVFVEATAVTAQGRITPGDTGIWDDRHIEPLARIAKFVSRMGAVPGIQLAHAGRKASCLPPWKGGARIKTPEEGGWPIVAPSAIPFVDDDDPRRTRSTEAEIRRSRRRISSQRRAARSKPGSASSKFTARTDICSHSFLSPLSNHRTDRYGGSFENRTRFVREVAAAAAQSHAGRDAAVHCEFPRPIGSKADGISSSRSNSRAF